MFNLRWMHFSSGPRQSFVQSGDGSFAKQYKFTLHKNLEKKEVLHVILSAILIFNERKPLQVTIDITATLRTKFSF